MPMMVFMNTDAAPDANENQLKNQMSFKEKLYQTTARSGVDMA